MDPKALTPYFLKQKNYFEKSRSLKVLRGGSDPSKTHDIVNVYFLMKIQSRYYFSSINHLNFPNVCCVVSAPIHDHILNNSTFAVI